MKILYISYSNIKGHKKNDRNRTASRYLCTTNANARYHALDVWSLGGVYNSERHEDALMIDISAVEGITGGGDLTPLLAGFAFGVLMWFLAVQFKVMIRAFLIVGTDNT